MILKWYGTASIELTNQQGSLLFDPFVPIKGSDVEIRIEDFDGFNDILVTHGHLDHIVNLPDIVRRNPEVKIYCTKTPYQTLKKKGVKEKNLILINNTTVLEIKDFTITAIQGKHAQLSGGIKERISYGISSRCITNLPKLLVEHLICKENEETLFYLVESEGKRIGLMGSLNLAKDIAYPKELDCLVLPYNGWDNNYPVAVEVINKLKPKKVFLDHYDNTFPPITMPLDISDILAYSKAITAQKVKTEFKV